MPSDKTNSFLNWLMQPSSWLSLIATIVSLTTFYLVNVSAGSLEVQLPEEVGVKAWPNSTVDMVVPTVFYNTGAPRRHRIVTAITATLNDGSHEALPLRWIDTQEFIGKTEFESRYPEQERLDVHDYVDYLSRSVPFVVAGGDSEYKMLRLVPQIDHAIQELTTFDLVLMVQTKDGVFEVRGAYAREAGLTPGQYAWFRKVE